MRHACVYRAVEREGRGIGVEGDVERRRRVGDRQLVVCEDRDELLQVGLCVRKSQIARNCRTFP